MVRRGRARLFSISESPYIILHCLLRLAILGATARFPTSISGIPSTYFIYLFFWKSLLVFASIVVGTRD